MKATRCFAVRHWTRLVATFLTLSIQKIMSRCERRSPRWDCRWQWVRLLSGLLLLVPQAAAVAYTPAPPGATNVSQFGAVGDGVTNDSVALRNAANWAASNGGDLAFDLGATYAITTGMFFDGGANFHVYGQDATLRVIDGFTPSSSWPQPLGFNASNDFSIRDLTIDGNRANRTPAEVWALHNIVIQDADRFLFESVRSINATTDGFFLATYENVLNPAEQSHDGLFLNVVADNAYRNGMSIVAGHDIDIVGSSFKNSIGVWPQAGIDIEPDPGMADNSATGITFLANRFEDNIGKGLTATGFHQSIDAINVQGNYFRDNRAGGLQVSSSNGSASNIVIQGNNFYGQHDTTAGIAPTASWETYGALQLNGTKTDVVVTGNLFADIHFDHNGHTPNSPAPVNPPVIWEGAYGLSTIDITGNWIYDFDNEAIIPTSHEAGNTIDAGRIIADPGVPPATDFDGDFDVDGADFLEWQRLGFSAPLDAWYLADWTNNFGSVASWLPGSSLRAVPEPGAGTLALMGMGPFAWRSRRALYPRRGGR